MTQNFEALVNERCDALGISIRKLAPLLGVSRAHLYNLMRAQQKPTDDMLALLAGGLRVSKERVRAAIHQSRIDYDVEG